jgi:hypothetical protein
MTSHRNVRRAAKRRPYRAESHLHLELLEGRVVMTASVGCDARQGSRSIMGSEANDVAVVVCKGVNVVAPITPSAITSAAVNNPPTLKGSSTLAYTTKQAAKPINTVITVTDPDNPKLSSATVKITNFVAGQDVLGLVLNATTMGNIKRSFNAKTGVMTLTSAGKTATLAQFQAALRAVTYANTSSNPTTTTRSVAYQANDGSLANNLSTIVTSSITIAAVNNPPKLAGASMLAYTEKQAAKPINTVITVNDVDNSTLASATVRITTFVAGQDVLGFVPNAATMGNIAGDFNATTGVMTLNSVGKTATRAEFQAALRAVTYANTSSNPTPTARSVAYQANDGSPVNNLSDIVTSSIRVTAVNNAPTLTGSSTLAYTTKQAAKPINTVITVTDPDNPKLSSATVKITNFVAGQDVLGLVLNATTMGNIKRSFNAKTGVMTLTSAGKTATLAQFQAALRAVTYANTSSNPTTTTRSVAYQANDGSLANNLSTIVTSSITISQAAFDGTYAGEFYGAEADVPAGANTILATVTGQNVTVSLPGIGGNGTGTLINGNFNATSSGTVQSYGVTVTFTGTLVVDANNNATGSGTWAIASVGMSGTWSITRQSIHSGSPVIAGTSNLAYTETQAAKPINTVIAVNDLDNPTLASATVKITNFVAGQDVLGFVPNAATMGNIAGSFNATTGVMRLTSAGKTGTLAQFQAALRAVTYFNSSASLTTTTRFVAYQVNDGSLANNLSNIVTSSITISQATFDGTYAGEFFGAEADVPAGANTILATVTGRNVTVSLPGIGGNGTGTLINGNFNATSSGTIQSYGVTVTFTGTLVIDAKNNATGSGTWAIASVGMSGTWSITRQL